jgi:quercetin 2,3-dioxygenase
LKTWHTFSFGRYVDRRHMGFGGLRVINEDVVAPGQGFGEHPHDNMEIVTYVLSGRLAHKDSMGNVETIGPGEVQRMSAGSGLEHSEFNASATEAVHLLQIWVMPSERDGQPSYEQKRFTEESRRNRLGLIASKEGSEEAVRIGADVRLYTSVLDSGAKATLEMTPGRRAWVQVARGAVRVNGAALGAGDGAGVVDETRLEIVGDGKGSEVLVFDLA